MKLKPKQRKKLLTKALGRGGVCCVAIRNLTGDVQPTAGVISAECSACGRTLRVNPETASSELVMMFLRRVYPNDGCCEHIIYWETDSGRVARSLDGDQTQPTSPCHCGKPAIVLEGHSVGAAAV